MNGAALPRSIEWVGGLDGCVRIIDQTRLPANLVLIEIRDADAMREAIQKLRIRGAPAIGIAGVMGAVLGTRGYEGSDADGFLHLLRSTCDNLATARPTAVNLSWALDRLRKRALSEAGRDVPGLKLALLDEAERIRNEDAAMCRAIGQHSESLIRDGAAVLTHCNAGALATAEYGTALAPIYTAQRLGRRFRVYATETRPLLQGSRLTAWELRRAGVDVTIICDSMVGAVMQAGLVDLVLVGADRIAANGDVANKIGTYSVAVLAAHHEIPFYVLAPSSTIDHAIPDGMGIPIEQRDPDEVRCGFGQSTAPPDVPCLNPAFDVTPARLVRGIITERGRTEPVTTEQVRKLLGS